MDNNEGTVLCTRCGLPADKEEFLPNIGMHKRCLDDTLAEVRVESPPAKELH